jgi:hypothetical protein
MVKDNPHPINRPTPPGIKPTQTPPGTTVPPLPTGPLQNSVKASPSGYQKPR